VRPAQQFRHEAAVHRLLSAIENGGPLSQRSLSREMGVALGLTNLLIRRLVRKGFVKVRRVNSRNVVYLLTPAGLAEKSRLTRVYLENTLRLYTHTRTHIQERLDQLSSDWSEEDRSFAGGTEKRIVFFGAGEVAEIAYVSLHHVDLRLVGVVDDAPRPFFGLDVAHPQELQPCRLKGEPFGRLVVMSIRKAAHIRRRLADIGFPEERVSWL
jgi:DNA-binding MarR family transcriptional regulator